VSAFLSAPVIPGVQPLDCKDSVAAEHSSFKIPAAGDFHLE